MQAFVLLALILLAGCPGGNGQTDRGAVAQTGHPPCDARALTAHVSRLYDEAGRPNHGRAQTIPEIDSACRQRKISARQLECLLAAERFAELELCDGVRFEPVAPGGMDPGR